MKVMKFTHLNSVLNRWRITALLFAVLLVASTGASLVSATPSLSQNYLAESTIPVGSIVSLKTTASDTVVASSIQTVDNILGVTISASNALIALTGNSESEVQVATSGIVDVLVSNVNGDIKNGDHITASPITGVGMKATSNVRIAGIAQGDLTSSVGKKETIKGQDGTDQEVLVGRVPVLVNVAYYFKETERTIIPAAIQNVANALAGKDVSTAPILLAAAIFIIMLLVVVSIIYSMIRSSIISVGRNPLSQSAIYRDLIQLSALVVAILGVGLVAIYLILTRL